MGNRGCTCNQSKPFVEYYLKMMAYTKIYKAISNGVRQNTSGFRSWDKVHSSLMWEIERISLIKKKCHEYDQEWRMICPAISEQRSCVKMKPCKIIIGLRTPQYERRLIASAATIAGIQEIHELYIDDSDILASKPINI